MPVYGFYCCWHAGCLSFWQEYQADRTLQAFQKRLASAAAVIRDGTITEVAVSELVRGDLVELRPGDKVPADIRLIQVR